jgi:hypothetical protein
MKTDANFHSTVNSQDESISLAATTSVPGWRWLLRWIVLTTTAIPAALLLMAPFAAILLPIFNFGVDIGIIPIFDPSILTAIGFFIGFAITLSAAQWLLLRKYLSNASRWFLTTGAGLLIGGMIAGIGAYVLSDVDLASSWKLAMVLLLVGSAVGIAQWLVLRRYFYNAFWVVLIDIAAACSLLLAGESITNFLELLILLILPGTITGSGIWLLMKKALPNKEYTNVEPAADVVKQSLPVKWIGIGLIALIPTFFLCSWVYAVSQLALAKNNGIYPTVEEAVIQKNSQGWGGAQVVKLEDIRASVNQHDGSQPHVWFGGARVYLDRVPQGWDRTEYSSGSYFLHVKEGWVHVPEGAFPEFIGWVMELYDLEGVDQWIAENG